ncbi:MAG: adenylate/guanylate cyclase domain-containing protein [Balneolaceae bacterium]
MKEGQNQTYHFQFVLKSSAAKLWPFVSDTNRIFRILGASSIHLTALSRSTEKGFLEISHSKIRSYMVWQEEPYVWEKPYRYAVVRHYKLGFLKTLQIKVELRSILNNTEVNVRIQAKPSKAVFAYFLKFYIENIIKRRLHKLLSRIDESVVLAIKPYENSSPKKLVRGSDRKLKKVQAKLTKHTKRQRIVNRLIELLKKAEDEDLERIHPYALAEYWGEKKYSVLNVFLHAAKFDLLDFSWDVCCPTCKSPKHNFRKLREARINLFCEDCDADYIMDFNRNTHLVFKPHPLIRKISDKKYCLGGPNSKPHRVIQQFLGVGNDRYLQVKLEEGSYVFRTYEQEGHLTLHVREDGTDNVTLYITDEDFNGQEITISKKPNLVISNRSSNQTVCFVDKLNWKQEAIYASEVSSSLDFRNLFSRETLKESSKIKASGVTMLFTDLMNSTELYVQEGDESAIGRVMSHFKIIQQIVAEERGGIVKTIGDSVMAVFREPASALKAVQRIQQIFTTSTAMGDSFKLKAGIHFGDCTAVNLNGRIDYFGTTVNIASRLVDVASEKEIMVSEAVFNHPDVQLFLNLHSNTFFVKESQKELKGFEDEEFKVKQIKMERPPMRLVI